MGQQMMFVESSTVWKDREKVRESWAEDELQRQQGLAMQRERRPEKVSGKS
jgi:hypothetical protein